MIKSDPIATIPLDLLDQMSSYAKAEIEAGAEVKYLDILEKESNAIHLVTRNERPVALVGVIRPTLLGSAHLWFLLMDNIRIGTYGALKTLVPQLFDLFPRVETGIEVGYVEGDRFARHFGFIPFGKTYEVLGRTYQQYEASAWRR